MSSGLSEFVNNGSLNCARFFEILTSEGCPLFRFVDDIPVNWTKIAEQCDRTVDECKIHYQWLLDTIFKRTEFSMKDKEKLCVLLASKRIPNINDVLLDQYDGIAEYLQKSYFNDYSIEVISRELKSTIASFCEFLRNNDLKSSE